MNIHHITIKPPIMKKYMIVLFLLPLFVSCGGSNSSGDKGTENKKEEGVLSQLSNATSAIKSLGDAGKDMEKLQKMTPLTNDQLKAWLPEEINGLKRISYSAGDASAMGLASIDATFANADKSKKIKVAVFDGAGKAGSAMISLLNIQLSQDFDREDEYKIEKTVKHNGTKAIMEFNKRDSTTEIHFLQDGRFSIDVTGTHMDAGEVWKAIEALKPDKLR